MLLHDLARPGASERMLALQSNGQANTCSQHEVQWHIGSMSAELCECLFIHKLAPSVQVLGDWVKSHTLDAVMAAMKEARVPAGPILSTADIYKEEQFQQRDMFEEATAPEGESHDEL